MNARTRLAKRTAASNIFDFCNVLESEHLTSFCRCDDHVLKLFNIFESSCIVQVVLEYVLRVFTECTGRCFYVLLSKYSCYV